MRDIKGCPVCDGFGEQTIGNLALKGAARVAGNVAANVVGNAIGLNLNGDGLHNQVPCYYKCKKCGCKFLENGDVLEYGTTVVYKIEDLLRENDEINEKIGIFGSRGIEGYLRKVVKEKIEKGEIKI